MPEIDVREIEPKDRHPKIMDTFAEMDDGDTLRLINDHDPKPLYYEMEAEVEDFDAENYEVRREGPEKFVAEFPKQ
ncbi:DUF2249 domain-containing protein [Halorientalis halophila]|uniref:DUF2249 domain-containing protein n=1 Tax=Halorientalis halophila TaxID=3108499 RepID=UPI00300ACABE